jgi:iron complex transport system permease protein
MSLNKSNYWRFALTILLLVVIGIGIGVSVGSSGIASLHNAWHDDVAWQIIWQIRLPRTLGAFAAGALLGLAGALAQGLFRNPLADPYLLGSASGATLGVAFALTFYGGNQFAPDVFVRVGLTGVAFVGALLAVVLTLLLAKGVQHTMRLLLAGVIVGVVMGAMASFISLIRPDVLQNMQGFLLGSTAFIGWSACLVMVCVLMPCLCLAWFFGSAMDALSLGESTALSLGVPLRVMRIVLVLLVALTTGTAVAQTGLIAFVGLAAPHLVRSMMSVKNGSVAMLSALMGGLLLLMADISARSVMAPQELPVGVLTAVLGGGYLLWLMYRSQNQGGHR